MTFTPTRIVRKEGKSDASVRSSRSRSSITSIGCRALPFSTSWIASSETMASTIPQAPTTTFEPIMPDTSALVGFGAVVAISIVAAIVWNTQVVPVSRTKLALSKKSGDVKEYLDGLRDDSAGDNDRQLEQWLFTDWLENSRATKDPALPILKKAKWNSGDNPVLAATALIMMGVVASSIIERIAGSMQPGM